ncbi:hypothetical protein Efla_000114 [Eimeria flavescens]
MQQDTPGNNSTAAAAAAAHATPAIPQQEQQQRQQQQQMVRNPEVSLGRQGPLLLPQQPASCASVAPSSSSSSSGGRSSGGVPVNEVYGRFAAAALVNTAASGLAATVASLLLLRSRGPRVFTVGLLTGAPLGWTLRNADLYLREPQVYPHLLPPTSDPLLLAEHLQHRLSQQLQQQLSSNTSSSFYAYIKRKFFPKD